MSLFDLVKSMAVADAELARAGHSPETRAELLTFALPTDNIPGLRMDRCGGCAAPVLIDVDTGTTRCVDNCGWTGRVLRRLP